MAKRQIIVTIDPETAEIRVNNAGNPDEALILKELADLSKVLNGDKAGFKIEEHVHTHGGHAHTHIHTGGKQS